MLADKTPMFETQGFPSRTPPFKQSADVSETTSALQGDLPNRADDAHPISFDVYDLIRWNDDHRRVDVPDGVGGGLLSLRQIAQLSDQPTLLVGPGSSVRLAEAIAGFGHGKLLIVTDGILSKLARDKRVTDGAGNFTGGAAANSMTVSTTYIVGRVL